VAAQSGLLELGWHGGSIWAIDRDGEVSLWSASGGAARGQLHATGDDRWLAVGADGRVDGNLDADELEEVLYWQVGDIQLPAFVAWDRQQTRDLVGELLSSAR
jgi:hypothetical protein